MSHTPQALVFLIFCMFCRQISHLKRVLLFLEFLVNVFSPFVKLIFLSYIFVDLILLDNFFVHFWLKSIPPVFFALMIFKCDIFVLRDVVWGNLLLGELSADLSWSFCTVFFIMTHCTTVLAGSFTIGCGLVAFLNVIVWGVDIGFGLEWGYVNGLAFSFVVLSIPRDFLDVFGSVLHWMFDCLKDVCFFNKV